jgi:hypothetical protein
MAATKILVKNIATGLYYVENEASEIAISLAMKA